MSNKNCKTQRMKPTPFPRFNNNNNKIIIMVYFISIPLGGMCICQINVCLSIYSKQED